MSSGESKKLKLVQKKRESRRESSGQQSAGGEEGFNLRQLLLEPSGAFCRRRGDRELEGRGGELTRR